MTIFVRDDHDRPLAVSCRQCGRFSLNTQTYLCARCLMGQALERERRETNDRIVTAAADAWLREGRY